MANDHTASLMTPAKLAQVASRPKAPVSPAAWLDQMAADAGHAQLLRLSELSELLATHGRARKQAAAGQALEQLGQALGELDFGLLESRGWWARTTGKSRSAGADFAARFEQAGQAANRLAEQLAGLHKTRQAEAAANERVLVEFEVEYRALDKIIDQGGRWLQDMRNQLKARHASAADDAARAQVQEDAARRDILVARLKLLRAVRDAAQALHQQAQAVAGQHGAFAQALQQAVAPELKSWRARLAALASAAEDGKEAALAIDEGKETHRGLRRRIKQATADELGLQQGEAALQHSLEAMGLQLAA